MSVVRFLVFIHSFYFTEYKLHKKQHENKRTKCCIGQKGQWH